MRDRALKLLRELGVTKFDDFTDRIMAQKFVYFLQVFGLDLGFKFSFYIRGPYSSDLADLLLSHKPTAEEHRPSHDEKLALEDVKKFLGEDMWLVERLEILAALHYLITAARREGYPNDDAISYLTKLKPYLKASDVMNCYEKLKTILKQ